MLFPFRLASNIVPSTTATNSVQGGTHFKEPFTWTLHFEPLISWVFDANPFRSSIHVTNLQNEQLYPSSPCVFVSAKRFRNCPPPNILTYEHRIFWLITTNSSHLLRRIQLSNSCCCLYQLPEPYKHYTANITVSSTWLSSQHFSSHHFSILITFSPSFIIWSLLITFSLLGRKIHHSTRDFHSSVNPRSLSTSG